MARRRPDTSAATRWALGIAALTLVAGGLWPRPLGFALMGLAFFGVLHLAVLVHEEIAGAHFDDDMTPEAFEHYCAAVLREMKWRARVTRTSGDQGVDIVADKRSVRIVVQCKKYSKPVGNRAVQEIVAGIAHEGAQRGVVVTTSAYTPAAQRLAESNDVLLLHHTQLHKIDRLLARRGR
jgi:restriction system protein